MATVVNSLQLGADGLADLMRPRHDVVLEAEVAPGEFLAESGPFSAYRRTVVADPGSGAEDTTTVTETTEFRLAVPFWGLAFVPLYKRELRRVDERDTHRVPAWAPPDRMDARAANVLGLLCTAAVLAGYLGTLITQTITFAAEEFGSSKTAQSTTLAAVRVGVLLSLVLVARADRTGRRRMLLGAAAGSCVTAALGALAPGMVALGVTQTVSRGLSTTLALLIGIVAAEEMPAGSRAYAISVMTMTGALGAGMCLWALPLADVTDNGWRILYLIPLLGLPVVVYLARRLPESQRFVRPHSETTTVAGHARRLWVLGIAFFLISLYGAPATQLLNEFLRTDRGFSASRIALFTLLTSTPGVIGLVVGGRMADVRGRRLVVSVGVGIGAVLTTLSFASHGWPMWVWSLLGTILAASASPALGMYGPELFPTANRGRANGIVQVISVAGSALGLVVAGLLSDRADFTKAMALLAIGPLVVAVMALTVFPETARRELEDINPEDAPVPPI